MATFAGDGIRRAKGTVLTWRHVFLLRLHVPKLALAGIPLAIHLMPFPRLHYSRDKSGVRERIARNKQSKGLVSANLLF